MCTRPLIPVHYISQIADYLDGTGHDSGKWLGHYNLTLDDVISDQTLLDYERFQGLIVAAIKLANEADIGLKVGQQLSINSHGALGFALLNCASLRQAIELFQRYLPTRTPLLALTFNETSDYFKITLVELFDITPIQQPFIETVVLTLKQTLGFVRHQKNVFARIELTSAKPDYWQLCESLFGCEVVFSAEKNQLFIDLDIVDESAGGVDQHTLKQAEAFCQLELDRLKNTSQFVGQVRTLLMLSNTSSRNLQQIASKLHLTQRTLHRYLAREGSSFKQILNDVLHTLAKQCFAKKLSVKQTAYELGYADVANFRRAFKRWQGQSPNDYRLQQK